jgi:hypothetical protein
MIPAAISFNFLDPPHKTQQAKAADSRLRQRWRQQPVWFFNESEKAELPAAFESVAKEAFLGVLFLVIFSGSRNRNSALS